MFCEAAYEAGRIECRKLLLTAAVRLLTMELLTLDAESTFDMPSPRYIPVLMALLVLICPFQCAEGCWLHACAGADAAACGSDADCDCACDREQQLPCNDGGDNSQDADCFCNGAVVSDGTKCPELDVDRGFNALAVMNGAITRQFAGTSRGDSDPLRGCHFPPLASGRDICALVGSYLL